MFYYCSYLVYAINFYELKCSLLAPLLFMLSAFRSLSALVVLLSCFCFLFLGAKMLYVAPFLLTRLRVDGDVMDDVNDDDDCDGDAVDDDDDCDGADVGDDDDDDDDDDDGDDDGDDDNIL